jgi:hypothetical protein
MTTLHVGYGRLLIDGDDAGETIYSFKSFDDGSYSPGVLSGNLRGIGQALDREECRLKLEDGIVIRIQVYEANLARGLFKVATHLLPDDNERAAATNAG